MLSTKDYVQDQMHAMQVECDERIERLSNRLHDFMEKSSNDSVVEIVSEQDTHVNNLHEVLALKAKQLECKITITRIVARLSEDCKARASEFFRYIMKLPQPVQTVTAYIIAVGTNHTMVVKLAKLQDKRKIFKQVPEIRELKNDRGNKYYISEQLPHELHERRHMFQEHIKIN